MGDPHSKGSMTGWLSWMFGVSYLALGSLVPFLALVLTQRGVDGIVLTCALGALPVSRLVFGPFWSVLADRYQAPTRMVRIGGILSGVGSVMLLLVPGGWMVVLAMAIILHEWCVDDTGDAKPQGGSGAGEDGSLEGAGLVARTSVV